MPDYQGNSNVNKENATKPEPQKKNLEKVVTGDVIVTREGPGSKFKRIFFGGDMTTASQYVVSEVLLPALRNLIVEAISKGTDRLIYGDSVHRRRSPTTFAPRVQYNNPLFRQESRSQSYAPDRPANRWVQGQKGFGSIMVSTKEEADLVIDQLIEIVDMYEVVSVADLYEIIGEPSSHVDNKWGWTQLSTIESRQHRDGWKITFPPLEEIS